MKAGQSFVLFSFLSLGLHCGLQAADTLEPLAGISLPSVKGRIDHFGVDLKQRRLFIAALGNDTLEVVDLNSNRRERSLDGFGEPQGILYLPEFNRIYVANGSANRLDILDGASLARIKGVDGLDDADNVRYDVNARKVYVGYGKGALRTLDPASGDSSGDIPLAGHPESFQLEMRGTRIFVNVPAARHVAVVDRTKRAVVATWDVPGAESNFPMALDESGRRLFVGARKPALLLVFDIDSGKMVAKQPVGGDTDDIYFDPARKRLYVICGEGRIDIVRQADPDH
jgi:DNA-binding beta-propeller fold protein YncE